MSRTKIEWADAVWNPVTGCTKVSEGCRHCYAERQVQRFGDRVHPDGGHDFRRVMMHCSKLDQPLHWRKPRRVFVCSMGDLFHDDVSDEFIAAVFGVMAASPQHTFMVLTKRPERMHAYAARLDALMPHLQDTDERTLGDTRWGSGVHFPDFPLSNVWLGVSTENQAAADERIPLLLQTPAAVRFVSCEPMLGPVDVSKWLRPRSAPHKDGYGGDHAPGFTSDLRVLDWVICGGESGPGARPMHPDWARSLRDQCAAAQVPFFFKQWGEWAPNCLCDKKRPCRTTPRPEPGHLGCMFRCGKKAAGRELDGRTHDEIPGVLS